MKQLMKIILNILFMLFWLLGIIFLFVPRILSYTPIYDLLSYFLSYLPSVEYKNTYISSLGGLLGTFMAVSGALWTQQHIDSQKDKKQTADNARLVYYDLRIANNLIVDLLNRVSNTEKDIFSCALKEVDTNNHISIYSAKQFEAIPSLFTNGNTDSPWDCFEREISSLIFDVNENWKQAISSLPDTFSEREVSYLIELYEKMMYISHIIRRYKTANRNNHPFASSIHNQDLAALYKELYTFSIVLCNGEDVKSVFRKLQANFSRDNSYIYW